MTGTIEWMNAETGFVDKTKAKKVPGLAVLQNFVGGYIEVVNVLVDNEPAQMIVNEDGFRKQLPVNVAASKHYATFALKEMRCFPPTPIVGNAVLLRGLQLD